MHFNVEFDDGINLSISPNAIEDISRFLAKKGFAVESGGILLGRQISDTRSFEITCASFPSAIDIGKRFSFLRKRQPANKLISAIWKKSKGIDNYLGEWHTHDQELPVPSDIDKKLMDQVVSDGCCLLDRGFMLIIGNAGHAYVGAVNPDNDYGIYSERYFKWEK